MTPRQPRESVHYSDCLREDNAHDPSDARLLRRRLLSGGWSCAVFGCGTAGDEQILKAAGLATDSRALLDFFRKQTATDATTSSARSPDPAAGR